MSVSCWRWPASRKGASHGNTGRWALLGAAEEHRLSKEQVRVIDVLAQARRPLAPREAAPLPEKTVGSGRVLLWRLAEKGLLVSEEGTYTVAERGGVPSLTPTDSAERSIPAGKGQTAGERQVEG